MRGIVMALVVSSLLAVPGAALARTYGDYGTRHKCMKAMEKEQKRYRKKHGKHAMQPLLRCKHRHSRYWLVRD